MQSSTRKFSSTGSLKDIWLVVREGSVADVDSALTLLKKNGGNVNSRNAFGLTALHIATWRNHIPIIRRLLEAGADPNTRDGESGWTSLHRALHFGHLAVASILLQSGASVSAEDSKSRTPVDLLSGPVIKAVGDGNNAVTELYSWGSGVNYQLGTGNAHLQKLPCKVDSLHGSFIKLVSAAKFHSVSVTVKGEVYTWGYGRGGRLGHPDFDIHSGQAAVITPRQVISGLGARRIKAIAAAKHHTVAVTESGEVFTWGSNREGQLGYTSVDTQATPRRVSSLRSKVVGVAAANKHTAVVCDTGEVFTWGCNKEGQLGYGTSNSGSNYTPRVVESLKGKFFTGVATAKHHTIVLGADGEVFTWGHRLVTPRRVVIARNIKKSGSAPLKFHRKERLHVVAIAAGMVHSTALADDGALFCWLSSDPDLLCRQLCSLSGRTVVSISAGKYWTAAVTSAGDLYMWDGKKVREEPSVVTRLHGVKRAASVSVGETHLLIISSLYHPSYLPKAEDNLQQKPMKSANEFDDLNEDFAFNDGKSDDAVFIMEKDDVENRSLPSLKSLCEKTAAEHLVEPRNALQMLEIADSLEANDLKRHCEEIVIRNLDYILTVSTPAIASASVEILVNIEKLLDSKSSESWSYRRLPTTTAMLPAIINSEEENSDSKSFRTRKNHSKTSALNYERNHGFDSFLGAHNDADRGIGKQIRALRKKLQQIEILQDKRSKGHLLDDQQIAKLHGRSLLESSLVELGVPVDVIHPNVESQVMPDGKSNKKAEVPRKQRRKSKQRLAQDQGSDSCVLDVEPKLIKGFLNAQVSEVGHKENDAINEEAVVNKATDSAINLKKDHGDLSISKISSFRSKKKNRKGGFSMFLSGALDDVPKDARPPPPVVPKSEGPAWGGAHLSKGSASLREIQHEQEKTKGNESNRKKDQLEDLLDVRDGLKLQLSSFLPSAPINLVSAKTSQVSDGERNTPPWAASGTPPLAYRPSLRGIQMQQEKQQQQTLSHSPKTTTTGFSVTSGQGSPSDHASSSRWFKPEVKIPSSIRSIQIEEKAMKDLKRFYSSVKIMKNQS